MVITVDPDTLILAVIEAAEKKPELAARLRQALGMAERGAVRLVSPAVYAAERQLGTSTVRAAIREGRLPCERIGRAVRVPADATIAPRTARTAAAAARAERRLGLLQGGGR